jgi:hypothetical protein
VRKPLAATVLLSALMTGARADQNQYHCIVEQAAGLRYDNQTKAWGPQSFTPGKRYLLRRLSSDDREQKGKLAPFLKDQPAATWAFFELGQDERNDWYANMPIATCVDVPNFSCQGPTASHGIFDKDSRRFELIYSGAYVQQAWGAEFLLKHPDRQNFVPSSGADDLAIEIGNCSPF